MGMQPWNDLRSDLYEVIQKHNESSGISATSGGKVRPNNQISVINR